MKIGIRKPSVKKRFKARTTGKVKRAAKKAINPYYGKKGMGFVNDPKKALYNQVYNRTSISIDDAITMNTKSSQISSNNRKSNEVMIHVLLFIFTAGIGNIAYLVYKYINRHTL